MWRRLKRWSAAGMPTCRRSRNSSCPAARRRWRPSIWRGRYAAVPNGSCCRWMMSGRPWAGSISTGSRTCSLLPRESLPGAATAIGSLTGVVVEDGRQPALDFGNVHALAGGIVDHLIALDLGDTEIIGVGMADIDARDR